MNQYLQALKTFPPLLNMPAIVIARCTKPRHYLTKQGTSKKKSICKLKACHLLLQKSRKI